MADRLIRAGIVLTGDAAGAVAAFARTRRESDALRQAFAQAQGEVDRLARQVKAFQSIGAPAQGVTSSFEQAKETARALKAQLDSMQVSLESSRRSLQQFGINSSSLNADLIRLRRGVADVGGEAERTGRQVGGFGFELVGLARQLAGLAGVSLGVGAVREVIAVADAYQLVSQRLRLVVRDSAELGTVQRTLFESAQATRLGYLDLADSYARLARNAQQAGFSQQQLLSINETIAKASTISGGSRESIQGSLIQLSQGIASNRLGGDELRSVLEQNSRLAQAIADGLGKSIGELRAMGEEGKLTADVVLGAIANSKVRIDREFAEIRPTAGQGFTVLKNSVSAYVDELNTASDGTNKLAAAQIGLARALDFVTRKNREAREGLAGKQVADSIEAQNTRELARARSNAAPVQASEAFLVIQQRLSGVNREFTKDLNTLFDAYNKGAIPVERYRELVEKLIQTDTEAGKSAKAAADARLRAQRELLEKGVADQQRLIDATRRAFEQSLADAKKYAADAAKLREDASQVRADAAGRAADRRNASLDPAERDARNGLRAGILIDQSAVLSRAAAQASASGDAETALKLAERAKKLAEDAGRFADKVTDDDRAASLIERAGEAAARAIETAAKVADAQAAQARSVADAQREVLAGLEERLKALQEAAAKIPVKLDTEEAKAAFEALKALFGQGFTVPLRTQAAVPEAPGFAAGGAIAGPGPRGVDSVLMWGAPGEHVLTAAEVAAAGGHAAIYALRAALRAGSVPHYAAGGIVDRVRVHEPALAGTGGGTTINLTLPGVGTFPVQASESVAQDLVRAARKRGRRT